MPMSREERLVTWFLVKAVNPKTGKEEWFLTPPTRSYDPWRMWAIEWEKAYKGDYFACKRLCKFGCHCCGQYVPCVAGNDSKECFVCYSRYSEDNDMLHRQSAVQC